MQDSSGCFCALGVFVLAFWLGFLTGGYCGDDDGSERVKRQAIKHGYASYVCDPATGATEFRWKEHK